MNRSPIRLAVAVSATLLALPALAAEPAPVVQPDWPVLAQPRPARLLPAQPEGTPSAISGDPTWPALSVTMPAIGYAARTDLTPVYQPPVEAHQAAMAAAQTSARTPAPAKLAAK